MPHRKLNRPLNVLLAEDDKDYRFLFEQALKEIPVPTRLAMVENGEDLMEYLIEHALHLPDLLFLDLSMPRKTGFECLSEIKGNELLNDLPVVVLTVSLPNDIGYELSMEKMLNELGAQDYIRKPHDFEMLKKAIHNALIMAVEKKNKK